MKDNILDSDLYENISSLTNFQLIGFLVEENRYDNKIIQLIENEIQRREISNLGLNELKNKYLENELVRKGKFNINWLSIRFLIFVIIIGMLIGVINQFVFIPVIISISIIGVKIKFEREKRSRRKLWIIFQVVILLLFILYLLIVYYKIGPEIKN